MNSVSREFVAMVTRPPSTLANQPVGLEADDSGIMMSSRQELYAPSILSSPAHSNVTPPTLPAESEISTVSSSLVFQGFSTLWIQLLISKLTVNIYSQQTTSIVPGSGPSNYVTPFTSPSGVDKEASQLGGDNQSSSNEVSEKINVSLEADGISLQVDIQERCTDVITKMASIECSYFKKLCEDSTVKWVPYLSNSSGRLFSTTSSSLPEELSRFTDPLSHPLAPFEQVENPLGSASYLLSPKHQPSPKLQPNFVQFKVKLPRFQPLKTTKLSLSVKPFEVVAWLPVLGSLSEIISAAVSGSQENNQVKVTALLPGDVVTVMFIFF